MWTRAELKTRAKQVLRGIYWKAFGISIVISLAVGDFGSGGSGGSGSRNNNFSDYNGSSSAIPDALPDLATPQIILMGGLIFFVFIFFLLVFLSLRIFLGFPLEVGGRRYFIQSAQYRNNKGCFRFAFNGSHYLGIILTMLLRGLQNFLWYLLLIIPGIVKRYAYSMVPYILADNPNIGGRKAIRLSIQMTQGHKFRMFVLDLSFIGWYLLGLLALIIGVLFVNPYVNATKAELYLVFRRNALETGMCCYEDLWLDEPAEGIVGV